MQEGAARSAGVRAPTPHVVDGPAACRFRLLASLRAHRRAAAGATRFFPALAAPTVANHMLLGDVGTGKTVVPPYCAPRPLPQIPRDRPCSSRPRKCCPPAHGGPGRAFEGAGVRVALLTGSGCRRAGRYRGRLPPPGGVDAHSTHALLSDDVVPRNLTPGGHRRAAALRRRSTGKKLLEKGEAPDALYLTATPIPRTLALALCAISPCLHQAPPRQRARRTTRALPRAAGETPSRRPARRSTVASRCSSSARSWARTPGA